MAAGEFDHALSERRAPEVTVKAWSHLRRTSQFPSEVFAPAFFIRQRLSSQVRLCKQFRRTQSVIDALTGNRIREAGCVAEQCPVVTGYFSVVPRPGGKTGNARRVPFGSGA